MSVLIILFYNMSLFCESYPDNDSRAFLKSPQGPLPDAVSYWNYLSASYWVIDAFMMRDMASATGRNATKYQQMADSAKAYIKENFLNEDGTFKTAILNTMQTPALFAPKNQLVEGEAKTNMINRLRENFAQHDLCLQTGFLGKWHGRHCL